MTYKKLIIFLGRFQTRAQDLEKDDQEVKVFFKRRKLQFQKFPRSFLL